MASSFGDMRCVVFDFDGTLVISNAIKHTALYSTVIDIPGAELCLNDILARPSHGDRTEIFHALDQLLRDRGLFAGGDPRRWVRDYTETCEREIIRAPEVPGAARILETLLERRIACYVNSSTPTGALERIVAGRDWTRYFRKCLGWAGDKARNLDAIAEGQYELRQILMVGDSQDDLEAAVAFGCKFVGVGTETSRFLHKPETMVPDLHALADRLFTSSQS